MLTVESRPGLFARASRSVFERIIGLSPEVYHEYRELKGLVGKVRHGQITDPAEIEAIKERGFELGEKLHRGCAPER